jgi:hypothetical protein
LMLLLWRLLTTKKFIYPYCIKKIFFRTPLRRVPFSLGNWLCGHGN